MYLPVDELDTLSRAFLELLHHEHSIPRLVRAFGLTERVVEDVLGDLIRKNRATLVVSEGRKEIHPLDGSVPNLAYYAGESMDVWQDRTTGIILPASMADPHDRPRVDGEIVVPELIEYLGSTPVVGEFMGASDAQLIDMLIRSDEGLRRQEDVDGMLDRLSDRYRIRPQAIWVPVISAEIRGQVIPVVPSERIPGWVTRIWSMAVRRKWSSMPLEDDRDASTLRPDLGMPIPSNNEAREIVRGWCVTTHLDTWRNAVERFLHQIPAPASGYELRDIREQQSGLIGALSSVGQVELLSAPRTSRSMSWLEPVFDVSRHWVVLVITRQSQIESVIGWIRERTKGSGVLPGTLLVMTPLEDSRELSVLQELRSSSMQVVTIHRFWPAHGPMVATGDGPEVRLQYAPGSRVLRFAGEDIAAKWLGIMQSLPVPPEEHRNQDSRELLRRLRVQREGLAASANVTLGVGPDALAVASSIEAVRDLSDVLFDAIVDPMSLMNSRAGELVSEPPKTMFDRRRSLLEQLPFLSEDLNKLYYQLSLPPPSPWAFWTHLAQYDLPSTFVAGLGDVGSRSVEGEILLITEELSEEARSPSFLKFLETVAGENRSTIHIGVPRASVSASDVGTIAVLSEIRVRIPGCRLRLWALDQACPAYAMVVGDLTFICGGDWLRSVLRGDFDAADFGFAIESQGFADSLRALLVGAKELGRSEDLRAAVS